MFLSKTRKDSEEPNTLYSYVYLDLNKKLTYDKKYILKFYLQNKQKFQRKGMLKHMKQFCGTTLAKETQNPV